MELRQLERFLIVAEELSFTRAANRLHIVQSALTTSIKDLERELGATLLLRNTKRVEGLTEAGKAMLGEARRTLAAVQSVREAVSAVEGLLRGTLTLGVINRYVSKVDIPLLLGRFRAKHSGVEIRLMQGGSSELMDGVHMGRLDLAVLGLVDPPPPDIVTTSLTSELLLIALPAGHPFA